MNNRLQFLLVVLLLHLPLFAYPILRLCHWLDLNNWQTAMIFLPLFCSQIVARMYLRHANSGVVFWLRRAADLWLGISPLLLCMLVVAELPVALGWLTPSLAAYGLIGLTLALTVFSVVNAYSPALVKVQLSSRKLTTSVRFVQITDVHIGSRSPAFLQRVMQTVNRADADFLCITGDFIDATGIGVAQLSALRSCPLPIYFSIGNHERYEDLEEILLTLEQLGVKVLRTRAEAFGEVQVIGIDDSDQPAQVQRELAKLQVDTNAFVLLLYHRPLGLVDAAAAGVDLMISGHTHNGQIVPFNFVVKQAFEQTVGLFSEGLTRLYVSPGTGTWGPVMRLGSKGEVTLFEVQAEAAKTGA
jgi:predicted MPP superfamily phosphohydrolase